MSTVCFSPGWFYGYDIIFHLLFAFVALVLALFAFRIFRITNQRQAKLFGAAFSLISASYFTEFLFNLLALPDISGFCLRISNPAFLDLLADYSHILLMNAGFIVLMYMTFKTRSKSVWAMIAISTAAILLSPNSFLMFYLIETICLLFISLYFCADYLKKRQPLTLIIAIAFLLLLFGSMHFFLSVNHQAFYVIGHFLELLAYILILANLYMVLKR